MGIYVYQDEVSNTEKKLKNFDYDWKGKSVLELGCNVGKLGMYVLEKGAKSYRGIDIDNQMVEIGKERYGLDLTAIDVMEYTNFRTDVTIALALFHHFNDEDLLKIFSKIKSKELIFEVPVGVNKVDLYYLRTKEDYTRMLKKWYKVIKIVDSGATNDPYNQRVIFYCERHGKIKSN